MEFPFSFLISKIQQFVFHGHGTPSAKRDDRLKNFLSDFYL